MKQIVLLIFIFFASVSFTSLAQVLAAPDSTEKSFLLDNEDLEKALAELEEETPPVYLEEETAAAEAVLTENSKSLDAENEKNEKEEVFVFPESNSRYVLIKNLSKANVQIYGMDSDERAVGVWNAGGFVFSGFNDSEIRLEKIKFPVGEKQVITARLLPRHLYRLRFNKVPPFSRINLQYKLQEPSASKTLNYMYLKVFVGQYELKRVQVSSKDSWLATSVNVGALSFLNKEVPVAFEFSTNQASGLIFSFIPETE